MASTINASTSPAGIVSSADASGVLQLQTGGTAAVTIDTSQNVGIGTSSPTYKLDVQSATGNQRVLSTTGTNAAYNIFSNTGQNFYVGLDNSSGNQILSAAYGATLLGSGAYPMVFGTNNTERMRIDSSGNVGIGYTSPSQKLDVNGSIRAAVNLYSTYNTYLGSSNLAVTTYLNSNTNWNYDQLVIQRNATNTSNVRFLGLLLDGDTTGNTNFSAYPGFQVSYSGTPTTGSTSIGLSASLNIATTSTMTFSRNVSGTSTESMRIDSGGTVLVGQLTNPATSSVVIKVPTGTANGVNAQISSNTGTSYPWSNYNASGTYVGGISCTSSATAFPTSSDVRLKKNIEDAPSAIDKILSTKVVSHDWIDDETHVEYGFIAQDLQTIVPQAVIEGKDKEDGTIDIPWGVDYSKIVPLLVKSIQELKAIIDAQAEQIKVLEAK